MLFLIQFDADPCIHGGDPLDRKTADGRTAFQLYIVDIPGTRALPDIYALALGQLCIYIRQSTHAWDITYT